MPLVNRSALSDDRSKSSKTPRLVKPATSQSDEDRLKSDLASRYDKLNELWRKAEDQLRQFMVPSEVVHVYETYVDHEDPDALQHNLATYNALGWVRCKGAWRLCHGVAEDKYSGEFYWVPITDCAIDRRKSVVQHFAKLRAQVVAAAAEAVPQLDDAIAQLADAIGPDRPKK